MRKTQVYIEPHTLRGELLLPGSKSQTLRMIFCAALADGKSTIENISLSEDISAGLRCATALGADCVINGSRLEITGRARPYGGSFDCGESGAALRFCIPCALALGGGGEFRGSGRLLARPQEPYFELFDRMGIGYKTGDTLEVHGAFPSGDYAVRGDVSSQFISGLLLALPVVGGGKVRVSRPFRSADYVEMTGDVMWNAGVRVTREGDSFSVSGEYGPFTAEVERDWSQAAFWIAARSLGADISLRGLNEFSRQPDRRIVEYTELLASGGYAEIDMSQCPDLLPPLALMAAAREGECRLYSARQLRYKESDRLSAVTDILSALGADIEEYSDELRIVGQRRLSGGRVNSHNDHRMTMMAAILATACDGAVVIDGAECVNKSYPGFFEDYNRLGGADCAVISGD